MNTINIGKTKRIVSLITSLFFILNNILPDISLASELFARKSSDTLALESIFAVNPMTNRHNTFATDTPDLAVMPTVLSIADYLYDDSNRATTGLPIGVMEEVLRQGLGDKFLGATDLAHVQFLPDDRVVLIPHKGNNGEEYVLQVAQRGNPAAAKFIGPRMDLSDSLVVAAAPRSYMTSTSAPLAASPTSNYQATDFSLQAPEITSPFVNPGNPGLPAMAYSLNNIGQGGIPTIAAPQLAGTAVRSSASGKMVIKVDSVKELLTKLIDYIATNPEVTTEGATDTARLSDLDDYEIRIDLATGVRKTDFYVSGFLVLGGTRYMNSSYEFRFNTEPFIDALPRVKDIRFKKTLIKDPGHRESIEKILVRLPTALQFTREKFSAGKDGESRHVRMNFEDFTLRFENWSSINLTFIHFEEKTENPDFQIFEDEDGVLRFESQSPSIDMSTDVTSTGDIGEIPEQPRASASGTAPIINPSVKDVMKQACIISETCASLINDQIVKLPIPIIADRHIERFAMVSYAAAHLKTAKPDIKQSTADLMADLDKRIGDEGVPERKTALEFTKKCIELAERTVLSATDVTERLAQFDLGIGEEDVAFVLIYAGYEEVNGMKGVYACGEALTLLEGLSPKLKAGAQAIFNSSNVSGSYFLTMRHEVGTRLHGFAIASTDINNSIDTAEIFIKAEQCPEGTVYSVFVIYKDASENEIKEQVLLSPDLSEVGTLRTAEDVCTVTMSALQRLNGTHGWSLRKGASEQAPGDDGVSRSGSRFSTTGQPKRDENLEEIAGAIATDEDFRGQRPRKTYGDDGNSITIEVKSPVNECSPIVFLVEKKSETLPEAPNHPLIYYKATISTGDAKIIFGEVSDRTFEGCAEKLRTAIGSLKTDYGLAFRGLDADTESARPFKDALTTVTPLPLRSLALRILVDAQLNGLEVVAVDRGEEPAQGDKDLVRIHFAPRYEGDIRRVVIIAVKDGRYTLMIVPGVGAKMMVTRDDEGCATYVHENVITTRRYLKSRTFPAQAAHRVEVLMAGERGTSFFSTHDLYEALSPALDNLRSQGVWEAADVIAKTLKEEDLAARFEYDETRKSLEIRIENTFNTTVAVRLWIQENEEMPADQRFKIGASFLPGEIEVIAVNKEGIAGAAEELMKKMAGNPRWNVVCNNQCAELDAVKETLARNRPLPEDVLGSKIEDGLLGMWIALYVNGYRPVLYIDRGKDMAAFVPGNAENPENGLVVIWKAMYDEDLVFRLYRLPGYIRSELDKASGAPILMQCLFMQCLFHPETKARRYWTKIAPDALVSAERLDPSADQLIISTNYVSTLINTFTQEVNPAYFAEPAEKGARSSAAGVLTDTNPQSIMTRAVKLAESSAANAKFENQSQYYSAIHELLQKLSIRIQSDPGLFDDKDRIITAIGEIIDESESLRQFPLENTRRIAGLFIDIARAKLIRLDDEHIINALPSGIDPETIAQILKSARFVPVDNTRLNKGCYLAEDNTFVNKVNSLPSNLCAAAVKGWLDVVRPAEPARASASGKAMGFGAEGIPYATVFGDTALRAKAMLDAYIAIGKQKGRFNEDYIKIHEAAAGLLERLSDNVGGGTMGLIKAAEWLSEEAKKMRLDVNRNNFGNAESRAANMASFYLSTATQNSMTIDRFGTFGSLDNAERGIIAEAGGYKAIGTNEPFYVLADTSKPGLSEARVAVIDLAGRPLRTAVYEILTDGLLSSLPCEVSRSRDQHSVTLSFSHPQKKMKEKRIFELFWGRDGSTYEEGRSMHCVVTDESSERLEDIFVWDDEGAFARAVAGALGRLKKDMKNWTEVATGEPQRPHEGHPSAAKPGEAAPDAPVLPEDGRRSSTGAKAVTAIVDAATAARTRELFKLVEKVNNRRARLELEANRIIEFFAGLSPEIKAKISTVVEKVDRKKPTADMVKALKAVLAAYEEARNTGAELDEMIEAYADNISKNLVQLQADSIVASAIALGRNAKAQNQQVLFAIDTSWVPGYSDKKSFQYQALNPLMKEMMDLEAKLRAMGLDNISVVSGFGADAIAGAINAKVDGAKGALSLANIVILAAKDTVESPLLAGFRSTATEERAFIAAVNPENLNKWAQEHSYDSVMEQLDIELFRMLSMALELKRIYGDSMPKEGFTIQYDTIIIQYDKETQFFIFAPLAVPIDYEAARERRAGERQALASV